MTKSLLTGVVIVAVGLGAIGLLPLLLDTLLSAKRLARERLRRTRQMQEAIRTNTRMLNDAFRLSLAYHQAVNELRKLGGWR